MTQILNKILYIYFGALIPITLVKLGIIQLDFKTNIVILYLLFALGISIYIFLILLGW